MSIKQWSCICGFTHQFIQVQKHFLDEHSINLDESVLCSICKIKFSDPVLLKQHSVIHIQRCANCVRSDSEDKLLSFEGKMASMKERNCSEIMQSVSLNNRNTSKHLYNSEQHVANSVENASSDNNQMQNTGLSSAIYLTNLQPAVTTASVNHTGFEYFSYANGHLNHSAPSRTPQLLTANSRAVYLHSDATTNQTTEEHLGSRSNLDKANLDVLQASDTTNSKTKIPSQEVAAVTNQCATSLLNVPNNCKVWSNFKSAIALQEMKQPNKLIHFYKCMQNGCSFTSDDSSDFVVHLAKHRQNYYKCAYCFSDFTSGRHLTNHMIKKHGSRKYQCGLCLYRASKKLYVAVHHIASHKNKTLSVLTCAPCHVEKAEKPLDVNYSLYAKSYRCSIGMCCFETFDPEDFKLHNSTHHDTVCMFPCSYCEASCFSIDRLIQHYQFHDINNYQCTYCLYGCTAKLQMLLHLSMFHADMPINVCIRSSDESTLDLQNSFINESGYGTLMHVSDQSVPASLPWDAVDITGQKEIDHENRYVNEVEVELDGNMEPEQNATCESVGNVDNDNENAVNGGNRTSEKGNKVEVNISLHNYTKNKGQISVGLYKSNKVVDSMLGINSKGNLLKRKRLDTHSVRNKFARHSFNSPGVQIYDCSICSSSFLSLRDAKSHTKTIHCIKYPIRCTYCARYGMFQENLRHHIITAHANKDIIIKKFICKRIYNKPNSKHDQYNCNFCSFQTPKKEAMISHLREELNYNIYTCGICRIRLLCESSVINHFISNHTDDCIIFTRDRNSYIEAWIEKSLKNSLPLRKFLSNDVILHCPLCYREVFSQNLRWHLYQHKRYKQYRCSHCPKQFLKLSHFNEHKTIVEKESSVCISSIKHRTPAIERWAKEIIQSIKVSRIKSARAERRNVENSLQVGIEFQNEKNFMYTNLDIHLVGIYKCYYCHFCTNCKYAVERHCRIKHFRKYTRFISAGKLCRVTKVLNSKLYVVKCWKCKGKWQKHKLKSHRLKDCKWVSCEKYSQYKKLRLRVFNTRRKNMSDNFQRCLNPFSSKRTNGMISHLQTQENQNSDDQIFSCYCCQEMFCSLKLFYQHWQTFHACDNGPFMFQLPIMKSERASEIYIYVCPYCGSKSSVFNILKDHIKQNHPSRIFKMKIVCETVENVPLDRVEMTKHCDSQLSEERIIENNLYNENEPEATAENIVTVNIKVEGLSGNLKLPVTYLSEICNIQPVVVLKDVLLDS